jgi:hypothetical protein
MGKWQARTDATIRRAFRQKERMLADSDQREGFLAALEDVEMCRELLDTRVGSAPTKRFDRATEFFRAACDSYAEAARAERRGAEGDTDALLETGAWDTGEASAIQANEALVDAMLESAELPRRGGVAETSRIEPRLSSVASRLAGHPVEALCWSSKDWPTLVRENNAWGGSKLTRELAGFAFFGGNRLHLDPAVCKPLAALMYRRATPASGPAFDDLAGAVNVLAHESEHLHAPGTEAQVECAAVQLVRRTARALGASVPYASRLASYYWRELYSLMPKEYVSRQCRNGGRMDINPSTDRWP